MNFNQVTLAGRLTRDIELRHTTSGTAVCDVGLAVNERVKRGDQWEDKTNFFDCTLWAKTAEIAAQYLKKGSSVLFSGTLSQETWEQDGQKRSKIKVVVRSLQMGAKQERNEHDQSRPATNNQNQAPPETSDDIPF